MMSHTSKRSLKRKRADDQKCENDPDGADPCQSYEKNDNKGYVLIFIPQDFTESQDVVDVKQLFKDLSFRVEDYFRYGSFKEIREKLNEYASKDHSQSESIIIIVLTYGNNSHLFPKNPGYKVMDLQTPFMPINCRTLAGKPKLFFIESSKDIRRSSGDGVDTYERGNHTKLTKKSMSIPTMADFLVMGVTTEDRSARDKGEGPFLHTLVEQLRKHHNSTDLLSLLTFVNRKLTDISKSPNQNYPNRKTTFYIESTLRKKFFVN